MKYLAPILLGILLTSACKKAKIKKITGTYTGAVTSIYHGNSSYSNGSMTIEKGGHDSLIFKFDFLSGRLAAVYNSSNKYSLSDPLASHEYGSTKIEIHPSEGKVHVYREYGDQGGSGNTTFEGNKE